TAHLAGYAVGFLVGIGLLATRLLPREPWDFLSMVAHRRRRAAFQRMARQGYHGWEKGTADALAAKGAAADPVDPTTVKLRREINQAVAEHDSATAGRVYRDLIDHDPDAVLAPAVQLDVANGLMSDGAHRAAAEAYRKLLDRYPAHPDRAEVELLLGRILGRYLDQPDQARELFESAAERTRDPDQRALARRFLAELDDGDDL
ncbi:MAG: hypothetical protein R3336_10320, partial [Phycisphaeraceae bacterium]|nr:hypothetical protein [Phycisphaeraceae bacterium]